MILNSYNQESAEYGLRTEKLKLVAGTYTILGYTLYDALDEELYISELNTQETVIEGGLVTTDLTVDVMPKGSQANNELKLIVQRLLLLLGYSNEDCWV